MGWIMHSSQMHYRDFKRQWCECSVTEQGQMLWIAMLFWSYLVPESLSWGMHYSLPPHQSSPSLCPQSVLAHCFSGILGPVRDTWFLQKGSAPNPVTKQRKEEGHDLLSEGFCWWSACGFFTFSMKNSLSFCLLPLALVTDRALMWTQFPHWKLMRCCLQRGLPPAL